MRRWKQNALAANAYHETTIYRHYYSRTAAPPRSFPRLRSSAVNPRTIFYFRQVVFSRQKLYEHSYRYLSTCENGRRAIHSVLSFTIETSGIVVKFSIDRYQTLRPLLSSYFSFLHERAIDSNVCHVRSS